MRWAAPCPPCCCISLARWRRRTVPTRTASRSRRSQPACRTIATRRACENGWRTHGVTYTLIYTNDVLANVQGGNRRGTIDQGKLETTLSVDLEKLAGLKGLSFFANSFQIHNTGRIRRDYVGGINTIAAIEAAPTIAAVRAVARAEVPRRRGEFPHRPARGRRRVLLQRSEHHVPAKRLGRPSPLPICRAAGRPIRCRRPAHG